MTQAGTASCLPNTHYTDVLRCWASVCGVGRRRDPRLFEAYQAAWRVRRRTGESSDDVLMVALAEHDVEPRWRDPASSEHEILFGMWRQGVTPRRAGLFLLGEVARGYWEVFKLLREAGQSVPGWMNIPRGRRPVSDLLEEASRPPKPLHFTADPLAQALFADCREAPVDDDGSHGVPIWLDMSSERPEATVWVGERRAGVARVDEADWQRMRAAQASDRMYADGNLWLHFGPDGQATVEDVSAHFLSS